jgi:hypothetical protein
MRDEQWLAPKELARKMGKDRRTVWRWARKDVVEVKRVSARTGVRMRLRSDEEVADLYAGAPTLNPYGEPIRKRETCRRPTR